MIAVCVAEGETGILGHFLKSLLQEAPSDESSHNVITKCIIILKSGLNVVCQLVISGAREHERSKVVMTIWFRAQRNFTLHKCM